MNLDHIRKYEEELKNAGVDTGDVSHASAELCISKPPVKYGKNLLCIKI